MLNPSTLRSIQPLVQPQPPTHYMDSQIDNQNDKAMKQTVNQLKSPKTCQYQSAQQALELTLSF